MKESILILLAGVLANNYAIQNFLGIDTILGSGSSVKKAQKLGAFTALVMTVSAVILWPLQNFVLGSFEYLQTLAYVTVIVLVAAALQMAFQKSIDKSFFAISINGAVLGLCLEIGSASFAEAILTAVGGGLGFMAAMVVFTSLRERVEDDYVPASFRGLPISLLIAAMMSLVLFGF